MGAAWIGLAGVVAGAVIAGLVAFVSQWRKESAEARTEQEVRRTEALMSVAAVQVAVQDWLTHLQYACFDVSRDEAPALTDFDEKASVHRQQVHQALAQIAHLWPPGGIFYSPLALTLRSVEAEVRAAVAERSPVRAFDVLHRTDSFGSVFSQRQVATTRWAHEVVRGRWNTHGS
ncbi:hypothetical protein AB0M57_10935 [Streptomyces sp. NPDC051597]|uniref:hypothetical protein n=1 Tax=Streptomyces sp. NPDC051597 TaxID=3155049 RepID=UPI00344634CC